jgi:hypothetical protein
MEKELRRMPAGGEAETVPGAPCGPASGADPAPAGCPAVLSGSGLGWLPVLIVAVLVYATSFASIPVVERQHSVLGDADAANYVLLLKQFRFDQPVGDQWNARNRSIADNAQKHKLHHLFYAAVGHGVYTLAAPLYDLAGWGRDRAVYAVNAVVAGANMLLLVLLLRRNNPYGNPVTPFVIFYGLALSTWVFSSIPESWPFSATLVLCLLLMLRERPVSPLLLGGGLGLIMLNNMFLAALSVLIVLEIARSSAGWGDFLRRTLAAGAVCIAVWLGSLALLSLFDPGFRPDRFIGYTLWFKQFTAPDLPPSDPYVWKSAGSNLFVNSVVSNQPDPRVPQEALQETVRSSRLGLAATAIYLLAATVALAGLVRSLAAEAGRQGAAGILHHPSTGLALWCVVMLGVTVLLFYPSGFLYSTVVVPVLALLLCRHLDLGVPWQRALLYGALAAMLANNLDQVMQFRAALAAA